MTQIIERVARAICKTGPMDPDEIGANDGPNWQRYIPHAQAALKEIKFEQLVGALKELNAELDAYWNDWNAVGKPMPDYYKQSIPNAQIKCGALLFLSELEKTE